MYSDELPEERRERILKNVAGIAIIVGSVIAIGFLIALDFT